MLHKLSEPIILICLLSIVVASAAPKADDAKSVWDLDSDINNNLFPYEPIPAIKPERHLNKINTHLLADIERESLDLSPGTSSSKPKASVLSPQPKATREASSVNDRDRERTLQDTLRDIAFNSREVRLIGPDQKEVEMKDDVPTKIMIALDNLQKEATEVWGQVNGQLDKGWTELKTMVEGALAPKSPTSADQARKLREAIVSNLKSSPVVVSDGDGYSMADEPAGGDSAEAKIKGFLTNIGLNEDNQKKASEALSKAGDSISQTVTKDIPDVLKKAGTSISDTVTKDIPEAFKNIFG